MIAKAKYYKGFLFHLFQKGRISVTNIMFFPEKHPFLKKKHSVK